MAGRRPADYAHHGAPAPAGPSVLLNLNLIFKPLAAGQTFRVEARITNDAGIEKGYDPVGTITVEPR